MSKELHQGKISLKMKLLYFIVLIHVYLISNELCCQVSSGVLTYEVKVHLGDLKEELQEDYLTRDSVLTQKELDRIFEFVQEKLDEDESADGVVTERWIYHYDTTRARIEGNKLFRGETFDLYYFEEMIRVIRRHHKGNTNDLRIDTMNYHANNLSRTYEVEVRKNRIYKIGEYQCYEILVKEIRDIGLEINHQLFVTEEIQFSPSTILEWGKYVTDDCLVYAKSWVEDNVKSFTEYKLINFDKNLDSAIFEIPDKFKRQ